MGPEPGAPEGGHGRLLGAPPPRIPAAAFGGHARLWPERGTGHAEHAADDGLPDRIGAWAVRAAG